MLAWPGKGKYAYRVVYELADKPVFGPAISQMHLQTQTECVSRLDRLVKLGLCGVNGLSKYSYAHGDDDHMQHSLATKQRLQKLLTEKKRANNNWRLPFAQLSKSTESSAWRVFIGKLISWGTFSPIKIVLVYHM